jgi:hypothetical protein
VKKAVITCLVFWLTSPFTAQTLDLPARSATSLKGRDFARSITGLSLLKREDRILAEVKAGNLPSFLRKLVPVTVTSGTFKATYYITPDYVGIGTDDDYFLTPLSPATAQAIADMLGCCLPTTKMVDDIYASATLRLTPLPIPPSPEMTTVPVFLQHNEMIASQRGGKPPSGLMAGHKKDVVISNKLLNSVGKVAIYGWHKSAGRPIQPLYTGHTDTWVDYSHAVRLVNRRMIVDGAMKTIEDVLADPQLAPLLSNEGVLRKPRYTKTD